MGCPCLHWYERGANLGDGRGRVRRNQLDGRTFTPEADTVITKPARRRLDASLAVLREAEGQLHRNLLRASLPELRAEPDQLMRHEDEYKAVIDTIRTACADAEANLASELATFMARPREAKRLLQNFLSAPGDLRVAADHVGVVLDAAATPEERAAVDGLCATVNAWKLTHPGDPAARPLRFRTQSHQQIVANSGGRREQPPHQSWQ
jgi:hypothetical protein